MQRKSGWKKRWSSRALRKALTVAGLPLSVAAVVVPLFFVCGLLYAGEGAAVMRVEEDWEAVLNEPDLDLEAPQFHTVICPYGHMDSYYLQVCWNYREQSDFVAGGMQLLAWDGDQLGGKKSCREDMLSTVAETVSWTQAMYTNGSVLTFEIVNGHSTTWGSFGGSETSLSGNVDVPDLNQYSTDVSVANSWISYGANRVNLLRIKETRYYDATGHLIARDRTPRVVYELGQ